MRNFENNFHICRFIGASASFTPHSDSEHLLNSEPLLLYKLNREAVIDANTAHDRPRTVMKKTFFQAVSFFILMETVLPPNLRLQETD
jgi:hypothetical protein